MYRATRAFGRVGLVIMAISAVDNAIWDAWAKAEGLSVAGLLARFDGAAVRRSHIPAYATAPPPPEAVKLGYRAVKVHFARGVGNPIERAIELVAEMREAVGPDVEMFSDAWEQWDLEGATRAAQAFAKCDVLWLEEPLPAEDHEGYAELARRSPVPLAGGEHEYTVHAFRQLAKNGALRVWQPDATWVGGMTQLRAIYRLAAESGIRVVPHRGGEVWALHAIAALDPQPLAESPRPWVTWLRGQPEVQEGYIDLPSGLGFGVEPEPGLFSD
jgi:L-alanine-DL-glutamate epimerase-like enolase superfamily enzyme